MYKADVVAVECIDCGALVKPGKIQRVLCWNCRSGKFAESPMVLSGGYWENVGGVQRWVRS